MDKRTILALAICFLILLFYPRFISWIYPPTPSKNTEIHAPDQTAQEQLPTAPTVSDIPNALIIEDSKQPQLKPRVDVPEEEFTVENDQMRVVLSNWGGAIKEVGLKYFHINNGQMIRLGPGSTPGWKTFQLIKGKESLWNEAYKGNIEGRTVIFESLGLDPLLIRKTFLFSESGYEINVVLEIENKGQQDIVMEDGIGIAIGSVHPQEAKESVRDIGIAALDALGNVWRKPGHKVKEKGFQPGSYQWGGLQSRYYAEILKPEMEAQGVLYGPFYNPGGNIEGSSAGLWFGKFKILPQAVFKQKFLIFSGPKEYFNLGKIPYQFQKIIDFGMFGPISKAILYLLHAMYKPFHSYGIAIILLTLLVKILTYPLTDMSFKSMKKMQAVQPHLTQLKEKHKDNPKKLQKEMMELYKEHGVNPMGGCLPMLIQLPIFIALYTALQNAIELKGSSFLWMKDLSTPDTVAVLAGLPINILPIIMGGTMVWQQKMSTMDPQQAKMMMLMPVFFTFIFYSFPSGLVLYWLVNNVLSILQQYQVQRKKT